MLRDYQQKAVDCAVQSDNGIIVLPTGSGKSHVIAGIVERTQGRTIILQPTKEILESNIEKLRGTETPADDIGIFSASMGVKDFNKKVTYATIGSIIKIQNQLTDCEVLIIDECHLTNAKGGQYLEFINTVKPKHLIGLTATPYRLHSNSYGSQMKMLTRTRPKIWKDIIHVTQSWDLVESGHLRNPEFKVSGDDDSLTRILMMNTTGAEYADYSIERYFKLTDVISRVGDAAVEAAVDMGLAHLLVFVNTIEQGKSVAAEINRRGITSDIVSSHDVKADRENKLRRFRSGEIRAMVNVGVLLLGYDFPRLDCIICARPTMSLALDYQLIGRSVRPHPDKGNPVVFDLVNNYAKFGNPLEFRVACGRTGLYSVLSRTGRLTGRIIQDGPETEWELDFGKYLGTKLKDVPTAYMEWYLSAVAKCDIWHKFDAELMRRSIWKHE